MLASLRSLVPQDIYECVRRFGMLFGQMKLEAEFVASCFLCEHVTLSVWLSGRWRAKTLRLEEEEDEETASQHCSCQDWDTKHEEAWDWLWSNVEKILGKELGKAAERVPCLMLGAHVPLLSLLNVFVPAA